MNKFKKFCPNVWVAECDQEHAKGDTILLETKYGKEVECKVFNLVQSTNGVFYYSIVKIEDLTFAKRKAERYKNAAENHSKKSNQYYQASQESREFLSLAEPIKVGHHSEKRHRALIERNSNRMDKCIEFEKKSAESERRAEYWESKAEEINLSMPESLEMYKHQLEKAIELQTGLKNGTIPREHSYSMTYATKNVKELTKKVELAQLLWG